MKKIVNGKRFDTEKSILVGEADNLGSGVDSITDFAFWEACLYRTQRSGAFFLAGYGGPMSRFSQSAGQNAFRGGDDLIPLSCEEALRWAETHLPVETVEEFFPDLVEDA